MKKTILIVGLVIIAVAVFGVGVAFAQGPIPYAGQGPMQNGSGVLHTYMVSAFAEKLGLNLEDVNARITAGETMYDIAIAKGIKSEDFPSLMIEIRTQAVNAAVKDGVLTQEQADWMNSHGFGLGGYGPGNGYMHNGTGNGYGNGMMNGNGHGMMGGNWQNQQTNP